MDHKLTLNRKTHIILLIALSFTLASSSSLCGWGTDARIREFAVQDFMDAVSYWPTLRQIEWSADGDHIVFVHYLRDQRVNRVYSVATDGSRLELIVKDGYQPSVSPDGQRIVYTAPEAYKDLPFHVETRKINGSDRRQITENSFPNYLYAAWSPDGTRIAFARGSEYDAPKRQGIYTMALDGSDLRWLLGYRTWWHVAGPVWSPDGKTLAFTIHGSDTPLSPILKLRQALYTIGADGTGLTRVFASPIREKWDHVIEIVGHPAWSPDGERLAFILNAPPEDDTDEPPKVSLITINKDGSGQRTVAEFSGSNVQGVSLLWSPDGTELLFTLLPGGPRRIGNVFVVNADGSGQREVGRGNNAAWSPDGSRIAVLSNVGSSGDMLYTIAPDGSDVQVLVRRDGDRGLEAANN